MHGCVPIEPDSKVLNLYHPLMYSNINSVVFVFKARYSSRNYLYPKFQNAVVTECTQVYHFIYILSFAAIIYTCLNWLFIIKQISFPMQLKIYSFLYLF
jgi:hypothetical protein